MPITFVYYIKVLSRVEKGVKLPKRLRMGGETGRRAVVLSNHYFTMCIARILSIK